MISVNGRLVVSGTDVHLHSYGAESATGVLEVAQDARQLMTEERFFMGGEYGVTEYGVIALLGVEFNMTTNGFQVATGVEPVHYIGAHYPSGFITFGVSSERRPSEKIVDGSHLTIIMARNAQEHPDFLGVTIEGVSDDSRSEVLERINENLGGSIILATVGSDCLYLESHG